MNFILAGKRGDDMSRFELYMEVDSYMKQKDKMLPLLILLDKIKGIIKK